MTTTKGEPQADPDLREAETVPLGQDVAEYFEREVMPFAKGAWIDEGNEKIGYEIPFTRLFYTYEPPRDLAAIDADIGALEDEIRDLTGSKDR